MEIITKDESIIIVKSLLDKLKKDVLKSEKAIEYFDLKIEEPYYEKLNCAYIQTNNLKEAILCEALTGRYFYIKAKIVNDKPEPSMFSLNSKVSSIIPKTISDKIFWVCGNKKDEKLDLSDFGTAFTLTKPNKPL